MGLFGQSTPFDADIEKATSETNTDENWSLILDVCDKVTSNPRNAKECLKAIMKRMGHTDPHVVMLAITLLDACVSNCGKPFHLEIASREFENEFRRLLAKAQPKVSLKMRQVLKAWAENDFKNDPELNLIPTLYMTLRIEGYDFSHLSEKPSSKSAAKVAAAALKDPNVVSSQQEEDDIAKAIELSLKESKNSPKQQASAAVGNSGTNAVASAYPSLYPSIGSAGTTTIDASSAPVEVSTQVEPRKVRALYDFEAAEENEMNFFAGDIIHVLDDSDVNWWKGYNQRGEGLFPANFVSADLSADPERMDINQQNKSKKTVQFEDDARELQLKTEAAAEAAANQPIEIDEGKIDRLLHLLHEANPEDPSQDSDEMLRLEQEVHQMGPLIDAELERVDRKHAQLTQLSSDLVDAINLYHTLMRDDRAALLGMGAGGGAAAYMSGAMPGVAYPGAVNAQMLYGGGGGAAPAGAGYGGFMPQQPPMSQSYGGLQSMSYAPQVSAASNPPQSATHLAQQIPLQFQNGHMNAPAMNGGAAAVNALPHQHQQQQPQQHPQQHLMQQQQQQPPHQQQMYAPTQPEQPPQNYQMLAQQQQQQQHAFQPQPHTTTTTTTAPSAIAAPPQQQQQQQQPQQYMPAHGSQYNMQQPQYALLPNGPGPQTTYMMQQPQATASNGVGMGVGVGVGVGPAEQYSQLQQQMAAMSMQAAGGGVGGHGLVGGPQHQPVTHNFLNVQNEAKNNIPIYQQQR